MRMVIGLADMCISPICSSPGCMGGIGAIGVIGGMEAAPGIVATVCSGNGCIVAQFTVPVIVLIWVPCTCRVIVPWAVVQRMTTPPWVWATWGRAVQGPVVTLLLACCC